MSAAITILVWGLFVAWIAQGVVREVLRELDGRKRREQFFAEMDAEQAWAAPTVRHPLEHQPWGTHARRRWS